MEFESKVCGIPCIIRVTDYHPGTNRVIHSLSTEPNEDPVFEFKVLDRKGYKAAWLENKLTYEDCDNIERQFHELRAEAKADYLMDQLGI